MSNKVLIITTPNDTHAKAVAWAAKKLGAEFDIWVPTDLPDLAKVSIKIDPQHGATSIEARGVDIRTDLFSFPVVWNRRAAIIKAPKDAHPNDVTAIEEECTLHVKNIIHLLNVKSKMINSIGSAPRAQCKAVELHVAAAVGLTILPTLISNDFDSVKSFSSTNDKTITKPYRPRVWIDDAGRHSHETVQLPEQYSRLSIELCPAIFQPLAERKMEVRLVIFGKSVYAAQVASEITDDIIDSRNLVARMNLLNNGIPSVDVPHDIVSRCHLYMKHLAIDFGAFDFIIDHQGNWIFLECNEAGQFLFLAYDKSRHRMLADFTIWLMSLAGHEVSGLDIDELAKEINMLEFKRDDISERDNNHKEVLEKGAFIWESDEAFEKDMERLGDFKKNLQR